MYTCTLTKSPHNTTACLYVGDGTMAEVDHSTSRDVPSTCTGASKANPSQYIAFCALVETLYMAQFHPFIRSSIHVCHGLDPKQTPSLSIQYSLSLWGSPAQNCNHSPKDNMLLLDWRRNERIPLNTCHGALPDPYWFSLEPAPAQLSLDIRRRRLKKKKKNRSGITPDPGGHRPQRPCAQRHCTVPAAESHCVLRNTCHPRLRAVFYQQHTTCSHCPVLQIDLAHRHSGTAAIMHTTRTPRCASSRA